MVWAPAGWAGKSHPLLTNPFHQQKFPVDPRACLTFLQVMEAVALATLAVAEVMAVVVAMMAITMEEEEAALEVAVVVSITNVLSAITALTNA